MRWWDARSSVLALTRLVAAAVHPVSHPDQSDTDADIQEEVIDFGGALQPAAGLKEKIISDYGSQDDRQNPGPLPARSAAATCAKVKNRRGVMDPTIGVRE